MWPTPRVLIALTCAILAGCGSSPTTPIGPLGSVVDLRPSLPATVAQRFPTDAGATSYATTQQVCNSPGRVEVHWRTARDEDTDYILSYDAAVVEPAPNYTLTMAQFGPPSPGIEEADAHIYHVEELTETFEP